MIKRIEPGYMAFLAEGEEGIGAVTEGVGDGFMLYVENAGEFRVPMSAVVSVHDKKVLLDRNQLDAALLAAIGHAHDSEDPRVAG